MNQKLCGSRIPTKTLDDFAGGENADTLVTDR